MINLSSVGRTLTTFAGVVMTLALVLAALDTAHAASSWNPTLLVNTESFEQIDSGDGTSDIELRFGSTTNVLKFLNAAQKFQFTNSLSVVGSISGSSLTIDGVAGFSGAVTVKGATTLRSTLDVTGDVTAQSNLTINSDAGAVDANLTFGNASGNQTIKFLNSAQKFEFSKDIRVIGNISGSTLTVDGTATVQTLNANGNIAARGSLSGTTFYGANLGSCNGPGQKLLYNNATGKFQCGTDLGGSFSTGNVLTIGDDRYVRTAGDTMTGALIVKSSISGSSLRISGRTDLHGPLAVTGSIRTDGNLTINDDADSNDAVLTFGNASGNETIRFLNSSQKFEFSNSIRVLGNISGSTLTVDGDITLHGVTYSAPSSQGAANTFLRNDGAGNLTWTGVSNGSGNIISMHPDYPGAVYFASGASMVGQLTQSGGTTGLDNSYQWTTSRGTLQDYWISVRGRVPNNFSSWDPVKALEFRFKTGVAGAQNNHLTLKIRDTAGTLQTLTGGLVGTAFTTARIAAPSGTWTPQGYFTVYVKVASTNAANAAAYASYLNLNYETTTP